MKMFLFSSTVEQPLDSKVAIVTGASSGIGAMIAKHLAAAGAMVAMGARRTDRLVEMKKVIEAEGGVAIAVTCDVTDRSQVGHMIRVKMLCLYKEEYFKLVIGIISLDKS